MNAVQITEAELRGANHQGKRAQPVVFYPDFYHLLGVVVDGIQNQRANALVALGLAQRRVSSEVITPESKACGIQIVARRKYVHALAQFVGLTIAQRRNSGVVAVGSKIKNEHVVLVVLQGGNQRQQFTAAGFVAMAQNDRWGAPQAGEKPSFPLAQFRYLEIDYFGSSREAGHADFRCAALRLDDAVDEKSSNGRRCQRGKKSQRQY